MGWAERLSQGGESPSVGIRPPPPCLRLSSLQAPRAAATPPPCLTPLCVLPKLKLPPCPFSPLLLLPPPPPHPLSLLFSRCSCRVSPWLFISPLSPFSPLPPLSLNPFSSGPQLPSLSPLPILSFGVPPPPLFTLIFSYPSPLSWPTRRRLLSRLVSLPGPAGRSRSGVHWWSLGAQNEGSPPRPHPERGWEGAVRLWPVWPEGSDCAVAWSPPPPGPAGLLPPPGWGRVNTASGSLRYLYRGPGTGPVPTTARALPCPPRPAPSQRGTSRQGDAADTASTQHGGCPAHRSGCQRLHWRDRMPPFPGNTSADAAPHVQLLVNVNTLTPSKIQSERAK